jgi:LysR family transcriptional regulator, nod-box dependent transcriptional activator
VRFHGVNLNLLVVMHALAEEGTVSGAAVRLNLSQPAVSNALAQLRNHYQDRLFVSVGTRMVPTELAQRLAQPIRDVLLRSQAVIQERSAFDPGSVKRRFFVAVSDYEGTVFIPFLMRHLSVVAPGITVSLRLTIAHAQLTFPQVGDILEHRQNDFVVLPDALASPNHPRARLYDEHYVCIAWSGNDRLNGALSLAQYLESTHVVAEFADSRSQSLDGDALAALGYVRKIGTAVEQFTLIPEFIVGTMQIATVHAGLARLFAKRFPLHIFPLPVEIPALSIIAQWNSVRELDPGIRWFLQQMTETARTL